MFVFLYITKNMIEAFLYGSEMKAKARKPNSHTAGQGSLTATILE